jgi:hypothetical protein
MPATNHWQDHTMYKKIIIQHRHLSCHPCRIGLQLLTKLTLVVLVHTIRKGDVVLVLINLLLRKLDRV